MPSVPENQNLEAKQQGKVCFVWDCAETNPMYPVVRRCPNRHVLVTWYCLAHGPEMEVLAAFNEITEASVVLCNECGRAMSLSLAP